MVPPRLKHFEPTLTAQHYSLILLILHTVNFVSTTLLGPFHRYPFLFERRFFLSFGLPPADRLNRSRKTHFFYEGHFDVLVWINAETEISTSRVIKVGSVFSHYCAFV